MPVEDGGRSQLCHNTAKAAGNDIGQSLPPNAIFGDVPLRRSPRADGRPYGSLPPYWPAHIFPTRSWYA